MDLGAWLYLIIFIGIIVVSVYYVLSKRSLKFFLINIPLFILIAFLIISYFIVSGMGRCDGANFLGTIILSFFLAVPMSVVVAVINNALRKQKSFEAKMQLISFFNLFCLNFFCALPIAFAFTRVKPALSLIGIFAFIFVIEVNFRLNVELQKYIDSKKVKK